MGEVVWYSPVECLVVDWVDGVDWYSNNDGAADGGEDVPRGVGVLYGKGHYSVRETNE